VYDAPACGSGGDEEEAEKTLFKTRSDQEAIGDGEIKPEVD
jgi:hypothetical protein